METRSSKSNRKRQLDQQNRPCALRKSQRLMDKNKSPMKITDLNDDCLLKIFAHFNLRNLFNVAIANEWLRPAAGVVFKRKFGMKKVIISNNPCNSPIECFPHHIMITGLEMCLQFLRCLGSSIYGLDISYGTWNGKQCEYIHQYVNKYCAESLAEIKFSNKPESIPIGPFEKPFLNVRAVEVYGSDLRDQWPSFAEWFPNMRSLQWIDVRTSRPIDLSKFDHLNDLTIYVPNDGSNSTMNKATSLLQQLPHLHSLYIWGSGFTLNQLLNIIKNHRAICNLKVDIFLYSVVATVLDIQQLINEHPLLIELEIIGLRFTLDTIILLISQLNALKHFRFQIDSRAEYDRLVAQLDSQWRSSFSYRDPLSYEKYVVQLDR